MLYSVMLFYKVVVGHLVNAEPWKSNTISACRERVRVPTECLKWCRLSSMGASVWQVWKCSCGQYSVML